VLDLRLSSISVCSALVFDNNGALFIIFTGNILGFAFFDSDHNLLHQGKKVAKAILFSFLAAYE
jgi:hypothetical protein